MTTNETTLTESAPDGFSYIPGFLTEEGLSAKVAD
jgi:hypothetical protein